MNKAQRELSRVRCLRPPLEPILSPASPPLRLIEEYRLYLRPVVLGRGKPFFAAPPPPLRLLASDRIGENVVRLTYAPA